MVGSTHFRVGPDPDRIAIAEARRLALPAPNEPTGDEPLPPQLEDAVAMALRLGVPVAADHYQIDRSALSSHVGRVKRNAPAGTYPRAATSYSCFALRVYGEV